MSDIALNQAAAQQDTRDSVARVTVRPSPGGGQTLRFALTVIDDLGNTSQTAFVDVAVQAAPVAVVSGPKTVTAGQTITLTGGDSTPAGHIKTYRWELVSKPVTPNG